MAASTPPYRRQTYSASCWAACMESLGDVSYRIERHTQIWYITQWGSGPPTGGLDYKSVDFEKFRQSFGFFKSIVPAGQVTEEQVLRWLSPGSDYFILIEQQSTGFSHARLAYNWAFKPGVGGGIKVMDPDQVNGGTNKIIFPADLNQVVALYW